MVKKATTVSEYIAECSDVQRPYLENVRNTILRSIDSDFQEYINYGMIGYVVPKSKYPEGYHCDPSLPLPFAGLAAQKNSINLYHMGIYSDPNLLEWFQSAYAQACKTKLDMGKSCIRFKKYEDIPYDLISELFQKMSANDWIQIYVKNIKR